MLFFVQSLNVDNVFVSQILAHPPLYRRGVGLRQAIHHSQVPQQFLTVSALSWRMGVGKFIPMIDSDQ